MFGESNLFRLFAGSCSSSLLKALLHSNHCASRTFKSLRNLELMRPRYIGFTGSQSVTSTEGGSVHLTGSRHPKVVQGPSALGTIVIFLQRLVVGTFEPTHFTNQVCSNSNLRFLSVLALCRKMNSPQILNANLIKVQIWNLDN